MKEVLKKLLQRMHLWGVAAKLYGYKERIIDRRANKKKLRIISDGINKVIEEICNSNISNVVYIFQHSYYTRDGKQYISGGGERYATDLGTIVKKYGFIPILFQLGNESDSEPWHIQHDDIEVIGCNIKEGLYNHLITLLLPPKLAIYSGYVDFGEKLHKPNIMISHGITWDNPLIDVDTKRILDILKPVDRLISVDTNTISWLRSTYAHYFSVHKKNMDYIPNYVDLIKYHRSEVRERDYIKIIFPRRLSSERGFWLIERALPQILNTHANVRFDFVGYIHTQDIENALNKLMRKYEGRVNHYFVDADRMNEVYEYADITLIPTLYSEGTSLSCIEAMACGNLVISTNVGGLPNLIINDFNGILINPNGNELLEAIDRCISDENYRIKLSNNAYMVAQEFNKRKWNESWEKILNDYLS